MVLQLHGAAQSTCTKRVGAVLHELKIPYEFHEINFAQAEHKSPAYLEKQPFGQVPYIVDDGFVLYESRAISRYLALKHAGQGRRLIPDPNDLKATALFEQGASIEQSDFDAYAARAVYETVFKKFRGLTPDPNAFNGYIEQLEAKLKVYEVILGKQKYIAGNELTVADIFHLSYGTLLPAAGSDIMSKQGPNVTRWWNEITSLPSWKAVESGVPKSL